MIDAWQGSKYALASYNWNTIWRFGHAGRWCSGYRYCINVIQGNQYLGSFQVRTFLTARWRFDGDNLWQWSRLEIKLNAATIYLLKVNNKKNKKSCETCSKLTVKIQTRNNWHRSGVFIVNFEYISSLFLVFSLLTLTR